MPGQLGSQEPQNPCPLLRDPLEHGGEKALVRTSARDPLPQTPNAFVVHAHPTGFFLAGGSPVDIGARSEDGFQALGDVVLRRALGSLGWGEDQSLVADVVELRRELCERFLDVGGEALAKCVDLLAESIRCAAVVEIAGRWSLLASRDVGEKMWYGTFELLHNLLVKLVERLSRLPAEFCDLSVDSIEGRSHFRRHDALNGLTP